MKKPIEFETFGAIGGYEIRRLKQIEPSCFNGIVFVKKYKVTIEEITELDSVIVERLQKLFNETNNYHERRALLPVGKKYGVDLYKDRK